MAKTKNKQIILYLTVFFMINSAFSFYINPSKIKTKSNSYQEDDSIPKKNEIIDGLKSLSSEESIIEMNKEGNEIYTLNPYTNYTFKLNNTLNHFFKSKYDNIFYDSNSQSLPKFSGFSKINTKVYANNTYDEKIQIEIISLKMKSNIVCGRTPSRRMSGIFPMKGSQIHIIQPLNNNYFYVDSYDKTSSFL